jgi:hypothetical protein
MFQYWLLREPSLCFGLPVYLFAAILFPLHLGWTGSPLLSFIGYVVIAAVLFSVVDAVFQPTFYPKWLAVIPQSILSLLALVVPAALAFSLGSALGPVDEAMDEETCARQGSAEVDSIEAEADDTFDLTADCAVG